MNQIVTAAALTLALNPLAAHGAETIAYSYDSKGRMVKVARSGSVNNGVQTIYGHDKANNRKIKNTTGSPN